MAYKKLLQDIKKGTIENLYLLFGKEQYLCEEIINALKEYTINPSFKDLNYEYMEGENITFQRIENACETLPFMDEKRLVIIKDFSYLQSGKNSKEAEEEIKLFNKYLEKIPTSTYLIFWQAGNIDKRKKLFQSIKKHGNIVEFDKLPFYELEKWLQSTLKKKGKAADKSVLNFFIENSDYTSKNSSKTLIDVENEINKIMDYMGERVDLSIEDIEKNLPRKLENDIFKMVDAIGKKDKKTALRLLHDMLKEGENEIKILAMITRQFRILIQCKELREKGYSPKEIASKLQMAPFVINKGLDQSKYFPMATLREALYQTLNVDLKFKSSNIDQSLALEMIIYQYTK